MTKSLGFHILKINLKAQTNLKIKIKLLLIWMEIQSQVSILIKILNYISKFLIKAATWVLIETLLLTRPTSLIKVLLLCLIKRVT